MTREELERVVAEQYSVSADYPFENDRVTAVFRHTKSRRWFAIAMEVPLCKFFGSSHKKETVLNCKVDPMMLGSFLQNPGVFPAYHMNKKHWISILPQRAETDLIKTVLRISFELTAEKECRGSAPDQKGKKQ